MKNLLCSSLLQETFSFSWSMLSFFDLDYQNHPYLKKERIECGKEKVSLRKESVHASFSSSVQRFSSYQEDLCLALRHEGFAYSNLVGPKAVSVRLIMCWSWGQEQTEIKLKYLSDNDCKHNLKCFSSFFCFSDFMWVRSHFVTQQISSINLANYDVTASKGRYQLGVYKN